MNNVSTRGARGSAAPFSRTRNRIAGASTFTAQQPENDCVNHKNLPLWFSMNAVAAKVN